MSCNESAMSDDDIAVPVIGAEPAPPGMHRRATAGRRLVAASVLPKSSR